MAEPNQRLRAAREATESPRVSGVCMSRAELAEAVNTWLATNTTRHGALEENYIARLEQGRVRWPGREYRAGFRAVLHAASDDESGLRPPNRRPVSPLVVVSHLDEVNGVLGPEGADRLTHVTACPRRTDTTALDSLAAVLAATRRLEDETSAAHVLTTVKAQQILANMLAHGAKRPVRALAVGLASEITQYLGWLHIPMGQWEDSRRFLDHAAMVALEASDPERLSTALSFNAYRSLRLGDYTTADALSDAAARDPRVNPGQRTYETFQHAEVLAHNGDRHKALTLLSTADSLVERLPPGEELPSSAYWYTPAFFLGHRARVLHALGDHHAAQAAARESLATMPLEWATSEWAEQHHQLADD